MFVGIPGSGVEGSSYGADLAVDPEDLPTLTLNALYLTNCQVDQFAGGARYGHHLIRAGGWSTDPKNRVYSLDKPPRDWMKYLVKNFIPDLLGTGNRNQRQCERLTGDGDMPKRNSSKLATFMT